MSSQFVGTKHAFEYNAKGMNMGKIKKFLMMLWKIDSQIRGHIIIASFFYRKVPFIGRGIGLILDRIILIVYGIYIFSDTINVRWLSVGYPVSVSLAGHGLYSEGRVVILGAVILNAKKPNDPETLRLYKENKVFQFGDNVVIGAGSIVLGPLRICDNVMIGAGSLVNKDITEPGIYAGNPLRRISETSDEQWVPSWDEI